MSDSQISEREREILRLVATGATNQQIAQQLNISANTVKVHLRNIVGKIGAASRTEATLYAVRTGLVRVGDAPVALSEAKIEPGLAVADGGGATSAMVAEAPPSGLEDALSLEDSRTGPLADMRDLEVMTPAELSQFDAGNGTLPARRGFDRRWLLGGVAIVVLALTALLFVVTRPLPTTPSATPTNTGVAPPAPAERWRALPAMPAGRSGFALAGYSKDGKQHLYVVGGDLGGTISDEVLSYDIDAQQWVRWGSKPTAVGDVQAAVIGNKIYVPGGRLETGQVTGVLEAYDPQNNRWTTLEPLPQPRSGYALAAVEGKLYLFGGWDGSTYRSEVWQYSPDQDEWSERAPMPTARAYAGAATLVGQIYVVGGENKDGALTVNERYTPSSDGGGNPWSTQQPLPAPRGHTAAATAGDWIFVVGGAESQGNLFVYSNSWQTQQIPLGALRDLRAQTIGGKLYILGGQADTPSAQAYEYQAVYAVMLPIGQPAIPQNP
jgi:DNA-binding CsgD family transcriptional regulator/N-acetylneuraminic acid mutarotase